MENFDEFAQAVARDLASLEGGILQLRAELAATQVALGVALMHGPQSAALQLRAVVGQADDLSLATHMTEPQRAAFHQHLERITASVEEGQAAAFPGGLRGVLVALARWWVNLRRLLVGAPWRGGIVRGLVLRWWTLGTARKSVQYEAQRDAVLTRARSGNS